MTDPTSRQRGRQTSIKNKCQQKLISGRETQKGLETRTYRPTGREYVNLELAEMVASLPRREPGSRRTSAVESRCQATLLKTLKSSLCYIEL
jgi:hypothetical protein